MSVPRPAGGPVSADLGLRPLTARSLLLSLLLGSHPARLPARVLVRTGEVFGVQDGTVRVALSRMVADGDVVASDGSYELAPRLRRRQEALDAGLAPDLRPWRGRWEVVLAGTPTPPALEAALRSARLAPLSDGTWMRPANLRRALSLPATLPGAIRAGAPGPVVLDARPTGDARALATRLWDLQGWAARAEGLLTALESLRVPAERFSVGAALVRHLRDDPVLPTALLPSTWPGTAARRAYRAYTDEVGDLLARQRRAGPSAGT